MKTFAATTLLSPTIDHEETQILKRRKNCSLKESMLNGLGGRNEIISLQFSVDTANSFIIIPRYTIFKYKTESGVKYRTQSKNFDPFKTIVESGVVDSNQTTIIA